MNLVVPSVRSCALLPVKPSRRLRSGKKSLLQCSSTLHGSWTLFFLESILPISYAALKKISFFEVFVSERFKYATRGFFWRVTRCAFCSGRIESSKHSLISPTSTQRQYITRLRKPFLFDAFPARSRACFQAQAHQNCHALNTIERCLLKPQVFSTEEDFVKARTW